MDKPLLLVVGRDLSSIFADWRRNAYLQGTLFLILLLTTTLGLYVYQKRLLEFNRLALTHSIGRKRVEDDLAKEKEFVETALDSLMDTFFVFEPRTGKAIRWNKALKELTGYADEEIAALKSPDAYYSQDDMRKAASAIKAAESGGKAVVELNLICKDGHTIPMEYVATLVKDPLGKTRYLIAIGRNITERKRAEQVLRDSEARFRAIIEASPAPFVLNDERQNITYLNSAFTRTFGYTLDDIPTLSEWWPRAYPDPAYRQWVAATWQTYMEKARRENTPFEPFELSICCKDGSVRTVMADVEPVVMTDEQAHLVSFYDITERKQAELEILRTKNLLQATLDAIPDLLFEVGLDGHIYNYHAHRTDLLAASPEVFLGKTFSDVLPAEVAQVCLSAIGEASRNGWSTGREYALQLPQGEFWFELSVAPMPKNEGQDKRFIALARDVTASKQQEQLRIEKERSHRVTLVREVHHRIKNNLQSVAGLLRRELGQFVELDPRLETAISQVNIIAVVHGLQGIELHEVTRLYEVVRNICTSVADLALRPVRFQEEAEDSAVRRIGIDKDEAVSVALVLNELVLNAVKHSPASGSAPRVSLSTVGDAVQVVICNATTAAPDFDIVSGKGISTGLSLVRSLMPEQGAELTYEPDAQGELVTTLKLVSPVVFIPPEDATSVNR
ncbi:MAG: PAS domain S-box protein [Proteobacteria bacterium]|nr:PAS domain S-box protein [Pseudomonadota bacterium]